MVEFGNGGRVVNMTSLGGITGITGKSGNSCPHYGAAKAAVVNMTQTSSIAYIPGLKILKLINTVSLIPFWSTLTWKLSDRLTSNFEIVSIIQYWLYCIL